MLLELVSKAVFNLWLGFKRSRATKGTKSFVQNSFLHQEKIQKQEFEDNSGHFRLLNERVNWLFSRKKKHFLISLNALPKLPYNIYSITSSPIPPSVSSPFRPH